MRCGALVRRKSHEARCWFSSIATIRLKSCAPSCTSVTDCPHTMVTILYVCDRPSTPHGTPLAGLRQTSIPYGNRFARLREPIHTPWKPSRRSATDQHIPYGNRLARLREPIHTPWNPSRTSATDLPYPLESLSHICETHPHAMAPLSHVCDSHTALMLTARSFFFLQPLVTLDDVFTLKYALHIGAREWIDVKYLTEIPMRISCRTLGHRIVATTMMRRADRYMMLSPILILTELRIADLGDRFYVLALVNIDCVNMYIHWLRNVTLHANGYCKEGLWLKPLTKENSGTT